MGNYSRDSFLATKNTLGELLGLVAPGAPGARNYISVRLQQAVPVVDADWNEEADIRRRELELVLARAIGNGVPAGSDGYRISAPIQYNLPDPNFSIGAGIIFMNGWVVYNRATVNYDAQPFANSPGVVPPLPSTGLTTQPPTRLVYLDAWEYEVSSHDDGNLVDLRIGVETCVRLERAWVVRWTTLAANANPLDPASIPNQQPGHRYCALATTHFFIGGINEAVTNDLRRSTLSVGTMRDELTVARGSAVDLATRLGTSLAADGSLVANSVGTPELQNGSVQTAKIAANAVTEPLLAAGAVSNRAMATNSVGTAQLQDGSVQITKIAAGAVTQALLAANSVGTAQLQDGSVQTPKIAAGAVTEPLLATGGVSNRALANNSVSLAKMFAGSSTGQLSVPAGKSSTLNLSNTEGPVFPLVSIHFDGPRSTATGVKFSLTWQMQSSIIALDGVSFNHLYTVLIANPNNFDISITYNVLLLG
jgi:hypothetical protein